MAKPDNRPGNPGGGPPTDIPAAAAGTRLYCPKNHLIGRLVGDVRAGEVISARSFAFAPGQNRKAGDPMTCKVCGMRYLLQNNVRTEQGWKPGEPEVEKPLPRGLRPRVPR